MSQPVVRADLVVRPPRQKLWEILTDFAAYPDWNPLVREVRGEAVSGRSLNISLAGFGPRGESLWPHVLASRRPRELRFLLRLLPLGFLNADWRVVLVREHQGGTRLCQRIRFSGWLARWLAPRLVRTLQPAVEAMNEALRKRVEAD